MANVYLHRDNWGLLLTNTPYTDMEDPPYVFDPENPRMLNEHVNIELTDDMFIFPEDATGLFFGCNNTCFNDMDKWDTSECTNMSYLFANCKQLMTEGTWVNPQTYQEDTIYLNFDFFDTSNVTNMSHMFDNCWSLEELSLNEFDVSKVTDFSYIFGNSDEFHPYNSLGRLRIDSWYTRSATNMEGMFKGCDLSTMMSPIYMGNFYMENVTNVESMFEGCKAQEIDLEGWYTPNVTNMERLFANCHSNMDTQWITEASTQNVTNMREMFLGCRNETLDLSHFDTSNADCTSMFEGCKATSINLGYNFDLSSTQTIQGLFNWCTNLQEILVPQETNWLITYPSYTGEEVMFVDCTNLPNWDGNTTSSRANNTEVGGYFGGLPYIFNKYIVYMKA